MRTARSGSCLAVCCLLPQCMPGYTPWVWAWIPPGVDLDPPGQTPQPPPWCGPGDPPGQTPQLPPWVWAWRPLPARPLNFPPGCGPADPSQPDTSTSLLDVGLDTPRCWLDPLARPLNLPLVWAWRSPWPDPSTSPWVWACRLLPGRHLNFPTGCGPGYPPKPDPSNLPPLGVGLETLPWPDPSTSPWVWAGDPPARCLNLLCVWAWTPARHAWIHTPPVYRILDTRFWKYYLAPTSLRAVIILKEKDRTCNLLCKRSGYYHSSNKTQVIDRIFELIPIHASLINRIL